MIKLALRGIRASLGRLVLMTIAIVAGVGFVSGAFILSDSLSGTFTSLIEDATSGTDAQIQAADPEFGQDPVSLPESLVAEVAALPEVGKADPGVGVNSEQNFRPFVILRDDGSRVQPQGGPIISFSWNGDTGRFITSAEGTPPQGLDQTAIDSGYAKAAGVSVGDQVRMSTPDGEKTFTVSAIVEPSVAAGAYYVLFDFASAQQLFDKVGEIDQIALTRAPGVSTGEMIAAVQKVLPPEAEVLDQAQVVDDFSAGFEQVIGIFRNAMLTFAGIALFVSLFIIYNTFAILVNQRLQQIGMLRAIGATRAQIRRSVLVEAVIVGVVGSAVGIAFGLVVAFGIKKAFQAGGGFPETSTVIAPRTIIVSLLVGLLATIVSALMPAFLAGRVSPIAAMRNEAPSRSKRTRRIVIGSVVLAIGLLLMGLGLFGGGSASSVLVPLAFGAIFTFVGVAMLSVLFAGPAVDLMGRAPVLGVALLGMGILLPVLTFTVGKGLPGGPLSGIVFVIKMVVSVVAVLTGASILASLARGGKTVGIGGSGAGLEGRLARQNAARSPQRTAATATALTIGIALVATVGVVGQSLKTTFAATLERAIKADLFIYDETGSAFSGELANQIEQVDGIGVVSRFRANEVRLSDGEVTSVSAYNASTGEQLLKFGVTEGSVDGLTSGGVMVFADDAESRGLKVGDTVAMEFPDRQTEDLTVSAIFDDNSVLNSPFVIDLSTYERHVKATEDFFVGATVAEGADRAAVQADVQSLADGFGSIKVQNTGEYLDSAKGQVDSLITLINLLLAFALFVAFLGVINTIVLSVIERTREIGLLRAVGMTRDQTRATIRWESVIVCLFGAVLGIVLGVLFATAAVVAIPEGIIDTVSIPWESLVFAILFAALAGVLAAVFPARRAAKLNVLNAITTPGT